MRRYHVFMEQCGEQIKVGEIEGNSSEDARFSYTEEYRSQKEPKSISISLPIQEEPFSAERTRAFFDGLMLLVYYHS